MFVLVVYLPYILKDSIPVTFSVCGLRFTRVDFQSSRKIDPFLFVSKSDIFMDKECLFNIKKFLYSSKDLKISNIYIIEVEPEELTSLAENEIYNIIIFLSRKRLLPEKGMFFSFNELKKAYHSYVNVVKNIENLIRERRIALCFQPIVDKNWKTVSYEILARLYKEEEASNGSNGENSRNLLYPSQFFPVLYREPELFESFETIVFDSVLSNYERFVQALKLNSFHINLSYSFISKYRNIIEEVFRSESLFSGLKLEVTEQSWNNSDCYTTILELLSTDLRKQIIFDDFGEGLNNIHMLFQNSPHGIKVGYTFIKNFDSSPERKDTLLSKKDEFLLSYLFKTVRDFARYNFFHVYVEGVENESIFKKLNLLINPHYYQGFLFGKGVIFKV